LTVQIEKKVSHIKYEAIVSPQYDNHVVKIY